VVVGDVSVCSSVDEVVLLFVGVVGVVEFGKIFIDYGFGLVCYCCIKVFGWIIVVLVNDFNGKFLLLIVCYMDLLFS